MDKKTEEDMKHPHQTSLIAGSATVITGLLLFSVVFFGGSGVQPSEVNTSADSSELLVQTFDRLETVDYRRIVSFNTSDYPKVVPRSYYEVSNSDQRAKAGMINGTDGSFIPKHYENGAMGWGGPNWSPIKNYDGWNGRFTDFTPKRNALREANSTVRKRSAEEIIVAIPNASSVSRPGNPPNRSERWVFTIDAQTGDLIEDEWWITHQDGNQTLVRNEYEYGITIERPENIPFSTEEQYYRFLAMELYEQLGLIGGSVLILVGCGVLYREYPLHRKLR